MDKIRINFCDLSVIKKTAKNMKSILRLLAKYVRNKESAEKLINWIHGEMKLKSKMIIFVFFF